ncbi:hypothetical protein [Flavobacterium nackdongense]|uniref:Uncharacterized protein n=1 Tax=Flavobacterium nackdongense TaxID=2547394 RepID=A0A4P6YAT1_9FLAO|nr:hypothetical protein [Flavobacterium nackdongense]QBN19248.1 hypothetical protein E1750_10680 [Flavobacterium nackdongense]
MEYAFNPNLIVNYIDFAPIYTSRVVLANDSVVAEKMRLSVLSALNNRWNSTVLNPKWDLNAGFLFNKPPRFKSKLRKGIPGSWHLFLQVIDNGPYPIDDEHFKPFQTFPLLETLDKAPYHLKIKAVIYDGSNEAVLFSNEMTVNLKRTKIPVGQVLIQKVPALTDSFLQAFDTAIQQFFAATETPSKTLTLDITPACLFLGVDKTLAKAQKLNFVSKNDSVIEQIQLKKEWVMLKNHTVQTGRKNNFESNLFNSSLTLLTGLETDKIREREYQTIFGFTDLKDSISYYCTIPFIESVREEKSREVSRDDNGHKSYTTYLNGNRTVTRVVDSKRTHFLVRDQDTIGSFRFISGNGSNFKNTIPQCWDGKKESTITDIPKSWFAMISNQNSYPNPYILEGEIYKTPFRIEKCLAGNQINIQINNQDIASLKIYNNLPVLGLLYVPIADEKVFSVVLMFSSLPFGSLN